MATEWWLELEYAKRLPPEREGEREQILYGANEAGFINLQQPEALLILNMLRFASTTYWKGGLVDQPYFLMKELNAAATGEKRHEELRSINRVMDAINDD